MTATTLTTPRREPPRATTAPPDAPPTEAEILARLAACTRDRCEDCGCEEFCVDYLRARLAEFADAPEPLPCAKLMSLGELLATDADYIWRITAHLLGHGDGLAPEERTHALEVQEAIASHHAARQWTYQRLS